MESKAPGKKIFIFQVCILITIIVLTAYFKNSPENFNTFDKEKLVKKEVKEPYILNNKRLIFYVKEGY